MQCLIFHVCLDEILYICHILSQVALDFIYFEEYFMNAKSMFISEQKIYDYMVIFEKEADGGYHAFCPVLKGCHSQGDNFEEALANITQAMELYVDSLIEEKEPIPEDDLIIRPIQIAV